MRAGLREKFATKVTLEAMGLDPLTLARTRYGKVFVYALENAANTDECIAFKTELQRFYDNTEELTMTIQV